VSQATNQPLVVASLGRRFGALLIDWILCVVIAGAFSSATRSPWLAPAILVLEYGVFVGFFAQTPGMWVARIRCVGIDDGRPIGPLRALLRGLLLVLLISPLVMDRQMRGWHDKAARSVMVPVVSGPASP
jgi:uncharacterized RDD family membrane protein YckC